MSRYKTNPMNQPENQLHPSRTAILFAIAGTSCRPAMEVYNTISRAAALRFPGVEPRWCFTSAPVRRKLTAQGVPAPDPAEALAALQKDGFTRVAVQPLHLADGMEFGELAEVVEAWHNRPDAAMKLALGHTLLTSETDWRRTLEALLAELATDQALGPGRAGATDRIILVLHGSSDPRGAQTIARAVEISRAVDPRILLGMTLGQPNLAEVVRTCQAAGVKRVWLRPCFVVAGFSAKDDIAGAGAASWASTLTRAGIEVIPVVKGLGEVEAIVQIWLEAVEKLLTFLQNPKGGPGAPRTGSC